jgi:hypothetical protein
MRNRYGRKSLIPIASFREKAQSTQRNFFAPVAPPSRSLRLKI